MQVLESDWPLWEVMGIAPSYDNPNWEFGYAEGYCNALAALGGLLGMAFAIQEWERGRKRREEDAAYERVMAKTRGE